MSRRYDTISFLSDYGTVDEFVGVVKAVIRDIAPPAVVIDLTHEVAPHDVRAGGLTLARCVQYLPEGIVLAVVDPGVGGTRKGVAVEVLDGGAVFIGPDNGLLAPAVGFAGGATRAVSLENPAYQLPSPGATFAGRDVFAPAAAHLCNGVPLEELGPEVDPVTLLPGLLPLAVVGEAGELVAEVLWVDRYGNAQLNVGLEDVEAFGDTLAVTIGGRPRTATVARSYGELRSGRIGLVVDSYGMLSVSFDRHSAAAELGLSAGDSVALAPAGDDRGGDDGDGEITTPVRFGR